MVAADPSQCLLVELAFKTIIPTVCLWRQAICMIHIYRQNIVPASDAHMHHRVLVPEPSSQQPRNEDCRPFWQCSISRVPQAPETNQDCFGRGRLCWKLSCRQMRSVELHHCLRLCQSLKTHFSYVRDVYLPDETHDVRIPLHNIFFTKNAGVHHISTAGGYLQQMLKASTMHQYLLPLKCLS